MWFVVNVRPGCEERVADMLRASVSASCVEGVFVPLSELRDGVLVPLVEGCVLVCAPSVREMRAAVHLAHLPDDLLAKGAKSFTELSDAEADAVASLLGASSASEFELTASAPAAFSEATGLPGGGFRATSGALAGREGLVRRKSARRKCAWLPVTLGGEPREAVLGLRVTRRVASQPCVSAPLEAARSG